ncbi:hypothetical protein GCM10011391_11700 [Pullulanibacillus camelliae]|uniref:Cellobiose phosphorylase n=1 Tax=Pullulanibacillus camelliae TaxID=1707096 RepID=A0A8J2VNG0_9BACL|nr:cellobiose phosphorylase [Pullulanibacillus camelliae]GGE34673.1 hypothetical protein GCM10011391_11700 [Pullulanibacillus camelliae]
MRKEAINTIQAGNLTFRLLNSGDVYQISHQHIMINQLLSNPIDGALNNLYLRLHEEEGIKAFPLLGIQSQSTFAFSETGGIWRGTINTITYEVRLHITEQAIWFWEVNVAGKHPTVDLIYGQDLGLAEPGAVRTNEAYVSQYIDHQVFDDEQRGYVLCSRQNQPQQQCFPYIQQGVLQQKAKGYSTDGFQFFGRSYKSTNVPKALNEATLENRNYQYEMAYSALQTERFALNGVKQVVFYGLFKADHPNAVTSLAYEAELVRAWKDVQKQSSSCEWPVEKVALNPIFGAPLETEALNDEDIQHYFPDRQLEETAEGRLLSFFTSTYEHVVFKEKEGLVERPHGHILMNGYNHDQPELTFATTSYMGGIFNSQVVVGNSNMNKMLSNPRNPLNIMKTSGQRLYVEVEGQYRLLTMPSAFEIGFNYARWYYKTTDDLLIITNFTAAKHQALQLHVTSVRGKSYRFIVTQQLTMNTNEYVVPYEQRGEGNLLTFHADAEADSAKVYPHLGYQLRVWGAACEVYDERFLASGVTPGSAALTVLQIAPSTEWCLTIEGTLSGTFSLVKEMDFIYETDSYRTYFKGLMHHFKLSQPGEKQEELERFNALAWWYTHNMLVHFSTPHGLEQYGGAAWGTRDVCQGPAEYFLATQNYETVKLIIRKVFAQQQLQTGGWPQWFMFDAYRLQQAESHGDVIVWPLKVIGDYLKATGDMAILDEELPYTDSTTALYTSKTATLMAHIDKAMAAIQRDFLHDTCLSAYGEGDWDDTLQPANQQFKTFMASSWTVALTCQTLRTLADVFATEDSERAEAIGTILRGIEEDFHRYILQTDVIPGFIYMETSGDAQPMLHPEDKATAINYRLLPMQRSIISELLTPEQAHYHVEIIKTHLSFPDGVRLMDRPSHYQGGVSTHFKRSEQAANFGREIGLQYVHAHIRFVEAMAKLGYGEEVWNGLSVINPIKIQEAVPNAEVRQSNSYFSSSDGKFDTREEAEKLFDLLRTGEVAVKGGWRIYSSGPGIYMNQLISNVLGIRLEKDQLVVDPVLPEHLDGLTCQFAIHGIPVTFVYHLGQQVKRLVINGKILEAKRVQNRYRRGGFAIEKQVLQKYIKKEENVLEIYI